jgi:hypothetical protein
MKFPVLSYTLLNTWDICAHQAARRYIIKDLPKEPQTKEMVWGNYVHDAMEKRVKHKTPLPADIVAYEKYAAPLDQCTVQAEQKLGFTAAGRPCGFFDNDVWFRGKVDISILLRTDAAAVVDWKTGKPREEPFELETSALLLQAHKPEITYLVGTYVWFKEDRKGDLHQLSNTEKTWKKINTRASEIQWSIDKGEFTKTPGPLCGFCNVFDCQHNRRAK